MALSSTVATLAKHAKAPQRSMRLLQSRLLGVLLSLQRPERLRSVLLRAAAGGSVYAALMLTLGGLYAHPWQLPGVVARMSYTVALTLTEYVARGCRPLFDEWTLPFELVRAIARCVMSQYGDRMLLPANARFLRRQSEIVGTALGFFACRGNRTETETLQYNGLEHMWVRATASDTSKLLTSTRRRVAVLYFHGGGFAVCSPRMYIPFASELVRRIQTKLDQAGASSGDGTAVQVEMLLANYRKIPEHPHPTPPLDALAMYTYLVERCGLAPRDIIVAGDSAGGGLALSTLLRLREASPERLPLAAFVSCPFADLEVGGDERKAPHCIIGDRAGISIYDAYHPRDGPPATWGDASPVHCDLRGLPPVYIQAAELDYILPHSQRLMAKARADGVKDWQLEVFPNVPHVFTNFPARIMPSAAAGLDAMAAYAAAKFADAQVPRAEHA